MRAATRRSRTTGSCGLRGAGERSPSQWCAWWLPSDQYTAWRERLGSQMGGCRGVRNRLYSPVIRMILTSDGLGEASRNEQPACSA